MGQFEKRIERRDGVLATATLACPDCDAPVVPPWRMLVTEPLTCSYCDRHALVRDFLILETPARAARVTVRVGVGLRVHELGRG